MWKFIGRVFFDLIFVTVLYLVSYTNRDSNAILQVNHLRHFFQNTRNASYNFSQVCWRFLGTHTTNILFPHRSFRLMTTGSGYKLVSLQISVLGLGITINLRKI